MASEVRELRQELPSKIRGAEIDDPVAHRVSVNRDLRKIVDMIQYLDGGMLGKINAMICGQLEGRRDSDYGDSTKHAAG